MISQDHVSFFMTRLHRILTKPIHRACALQNGGHSLGKRPPEQGRLHVQGRPKRCLSIDPHPGIPSKVPQVSLAGQDIPVQCPSFWPNDGSTSVHQSPQASPQPPEIKGHKNGGIPRRPVTHRQNQGGNRECLQDNCGPPGGAGIRGE